MVVDHQDLASVHEAKQEIERQVKAAMQKPLEDIDSPISVSVDLQALRHCENPEERSFAEFVLAVAELRSDLSRIEKRLSDPENLVPPQYAQTWIGLRGRLKFREFEMTLIDLAHQLNKTLLDFVSDKAPPKQVLMDHLEAIRALLMTMRREFPM